MNDIVQTNYARDLRVKAATSELRVFLWITLVIQIVLFFAEATSRHGMGTDIDFGSTAIRVNLGLTALKTVAVIVLNRTLAAGKKGACYLVLLGGVSYPPFVLFIRSAPLTWLEYLNLGLVAIGCWFAWKSLTALRDPRPVS